MIKIGDNGNGFHMTFANGWTVSVQFGSGNYCKNHATFAPKVEKSDSPDAEIAAWNAQGMWFDFRTGGVFPKGKNDVRGYQTPDQVAAFIAQIAAM